MFYSVLLSRTLAVVEMPPGQVELNHKIFCLEWLKWLKLHGYVCSRQTSILLSASCAVYIKNLDQLSNPHLSDVWFC